MQLHDARLVRLVILVVLAVGAAGCEMVGDIFQAGMWVGVIVVVLILMLAGFIASKFRSGPR
jgi:hypothetical protein